MTQLSSERHRCTRYDHVSPAASAARTGVIFRLRPPLSCDAKPPEPLGTWTAGHKSSAQDHAACQACLTRLTPETSKIPGHTGPGPYSRFVRGYLRGPSHTRPVRGGSEPVVDSFGAEPVCPRRHGKPTWAPAGIPCSRRNSTPSMGRRNELEPGSWPRGRKAWDTRGGGRHSPP